MHEVNVSVTPETAAARVIHGYPAEIGLDALMDHVGGADLFLYVEPFGIVPRGLDTAPVPTVCVLCDTHRNPRARRLIASLFDHVVVYHRNHLAAYRDRPAGTAHWIPYACDTEVVRDLGRARDLDVAFIGRPYTRERRRIIAALAKRYRLNDQRPYRQGEIAEIYSRAKIVIDLPDGDNIPFRVFEAMSCGALLITRRMPSGIEELFREGEHYEAFASEGELLDKVDRYLREDDRRTAMAARGHAEIQRRHTLSLRMRQLVDAVEQGPRFAAPVRGMSAAERDATYARVYERMGRVDGLLTLARTASDRRSAWTWRWYAARALARRTVLRW